MSFNELDTSDDAGGGLKVHWLASATRGSKGWFRYYKDFQTAFQRHPMVSACEGTFDKCKKNDVIFLGHDSTTRLKDFEKDYEAVMKALKSHRLNKDSKLGIFFNKEYNDWDGKMKLIKNLANAFPKTIVFTHSSRADQWSEQYKLHFVYVPFAVDFKTFDLHNGLIPFSQRKHDLFFSGEVNSTKYALRQNIVDAFPEMSKQGIRINASLGLLHPTGDISLDNEASNLFLTQEEYKGVIRNTKMSFATTGLGELMLVGTRYYEIMASGTTLLLCERIDDSKYARVGDSTYTQLGIKEDVNVVMFSSVSEFIDKVKYYKDPEHAEEAMKIITSAQELTRNKHTWGHRAQQVVDAMNSL